MEGLEERGILTFLRIRTIQGVLTFVLFENGLGGMNGNCIESKGVGVVNLV